MSVNVVRSGSPKLVMWLKRNAKKINRALAVIAVIL